MTAVRVLLRSEYRDSGSLMRLARDLEARPGVVRAVALMATPRNLEQLGAMAGLAGLLPSLPPARPSDLLVAVEAKAAEDAEAALAAVDALLARKGGSGPARPGDGPARPRTLDDALARQEGTSLAVISVPGPFAAGEARKALRRGLHVFLFSNGVSLEDEVSLKAEAAERGLLVMGPDCGTAIVDGVPIGFANRVRRGPIGLVGASGTGLQEVTTRIHALGSGVSHAVGTGGRDLSEAVGGATARAALALLSRDASTRVIVLVGKPPSPGVVAGLLAEASASGRPVVACFLGWSGERAGALPPGVVLAGTLAEAAERACALAGVVPAVAPDDDPGPSPAPARGDLLGLYSGGTLAHEALLLLCAAGLDVSSNLRVAGVGKPGRGGHTVLDLGEEEYTRGRLHPMIDPALRTEAILRAGQDASCGLLLLDVVLGHGAHPDPAGALAAPIVEARRAAAARGDALTVIASVTGTVLDPQDRAAQVARLRSAGVHVAPSNAAAARLAARHLARGGGA